MPRKTSTGRNVLLTLENEEFPGVISFLDDKSVEVRVGEPAPAIFAFDSNQDICSCRYNTSTTIIKQDFGSVKYRQLFRCAWDHSLYHTEEKQHEGHDYLSVAFFTCQNDDFEYLEHQSLPDIDIDREIRFLDRYTFLSRNGISRNIVLLNEDFHLSRRIILDCSVYAILGHGFIFFYQNYVYYVNYNREQLESYDVIDIHCEDLQVLRADSMFYKQQKMTDTFTFGYYLFLSNRYESYYVLYMDGDILKKINLVKEFPMFSKLSRLADVEFLQLKLDGPEKVLVISAFLNQKSCILILKENFCRTPGYCPLDVTFFSSKKNFSRNFNFLPNITSRYYFAKNSSTLVKTTSLIDTNQTILSIQNVNRSIRKVLDDCIIFAEPHQLFTWNFINNTIHSTRPWVFWSPFVDENYNIDPQYITGHVVFERTKRLVKSMYCYDMRAAMDGSCRGFKLIMPENAVLLKIGNESLWFSVSVFARGSSQIIKVYEYEYSVNELKVLFECNLPTITRPFFVNDHCILFRDSASGFYYQYEDDKWEAATDMWSYCINTKGFTTITVGSKNYNIKGQFICTARDNLAIFVDAVYLITSEAFEEQPFGLKLVDLKEEGLVGSKKHINLLPNGFSIVHLNQESMKLLHRIYTFKQDNSYDVDVKDCNMFDVLAESKYFDFTDCFLSFDLCFLTEPLHEFNIISQL
ncbi:hypothetical protein PCE1_003649 [Barthelona sp. PCE]